MFATRRPDCESHTACHTLPPRTWMGERPRRLGLREKSMPPLPTSVFGLSISLLNGSRTTVKPMEATAPQIPALVQRLPDEKIEHGERKISSSCCDSNNGGAYFVVSMLKQHEKTSLQTPCSLTRERSARPPTTCRPSEAPYQLTPANL